jgi:hypothetical protein
MLSRTGRTIWRVIIPKSLIVHIPEMKKTAWWHGPAGHFYNCLVDDPSETPEDKQMFEIAVHNVVPAATVKEKRFSWGIPATNERVESHFTVMIQEYEKHSLKFQKDYGKNSRLSQVQDSRKSRLGIK